MKQLNLKKKLQKNIKDKPEAYSRLIEKNAKAKFKDAEAK